MSLFEKSVWSAGVLLFIMLASVLLSLGTFTAHIESLINQNLASSGVSHKVTAVLLNFRSLDTLLETGVILLSLIAFYIITPLYKHEPERFHSIIANQFVTLLFPIIAIAAIYLLWSGAFQSGGAFQAAALLGGGFIIIKLTKAEIFEKIYLYNLKILYSFGFFIFLLVGSLSMFHSQFLNYYDGYATISIIIVETVLTLSLGAILGAYFILSTQRLKR